VLSKVVVVGENTTDDTVQPLFPEEVQGVRLYSGKKATVLDLDALPQIQTDNYRQAFAKVPGLLTSELSNPSLLSLGYRGIGDPHESQNLLVLKDGLPFVVDLLGYPTVYYAPPFESLDRFEFVRGGAALMYGPQPSGALNYVTHEPRADRPAALSTQHVFGSDSLYSTYTTLDGTSGQLGYLLGFDHRQGDSFRHENSDYLLNGGSARFVLAASPSTRWGLDLDVYTADSGEPGGLTFNPAPGYLNYDADRMATQLRYDRVRVERYVPVLSLDYAGWENASLAARVWGGHYSRFSKRQRNSGGSAFGNVANLIDSNTLADHEYDFGGLDLRVRQDWLAGTEVHALTAGVTGYGSSAPYREDRGATADAETGTARVRTDRSTAYGALFAENLFRFGRFRITPGIRLEWNHQNVVEELNLNKTSPLLRDDYLDVVPLTGLGLAYELDSGITAYANASQGYKAKTYSDAVPPQNNTAVNESLDPATSWTYETGIRGHPAPWLTFDSSLFLIDYDHRFGTVTEGAVSTIQNVGRSINQGWEVGSELDLVGLADSLCPSRGAPRQASLNLYANFQWLDAAFVSGPLDGRTPQYAPETMVRTGLIYRRGPAVKVSLLGTFLGDHFANDNNTADFRIPGYMVWDLTAEVKVYRNHVGLLGGVNNLFDEDYYSRIRANGIDPAYGRNFYVGARITL
jgi:Fe(3+) dicitrate transport protein